MKLGFQNLNFEKVDALKLDVAAGCWRPAPGDAIAAALESSELLNAFRKKQVAPAPSTAVLFTLNSVEIIGDS